MNQSKLGGNEMEGNNFLDKLRSYKRMQHVNGYFEVAEDGVWFYKDNNEDKQKLFICSPIIVLAKTRDDSSNGWGRLLQWLDDAGVLHTWAMSMQHFQTDGAEIRKALADQGVTISVNGYERKLFLIYLANYPITQLAVCVNRIGWYRNQFILPDRTIGQNDGNEIVVYQSDNASLSKYSTKGTLHEWQHNISKLAVNHPFLILAISLAFSGQLLEPLNQNGTGIHFKGKSSKGKSTAEFVACTVFGDPESYHCTWRNTGNALEKTAFMHNDSLLVLDEIGEIPNPKELGSIVYMLINGSGKGRMTKTLNLKEPNRWRLVFLSSGEKTLSELMVEVGQKSKLGQEIRLINIDIDASPYGIFNSIDFAENAGAQAIFLNQNAKQFYGTAGEKWLEYLTQDKPEIIELAKSLFVEYSEKLIGNHRQGHVIRVANSFSLIAVAGELATQANITMWPNGCAFNAIEIVFNDWINNLDQIGNYEDREILEYIKSFFILHGSSRFERIDEHNNATFSSDYTQKIINRIGYYKIDNTGTNYFVSPEIFKTEICGHLNYKKVANVLKEYNWIECDVGRTTKSIRLPGSRNTARMMIFNFTNINNYTSEKT